MIDCVDWRELRAVGAGCYEPFFVIAQKISRQWKFFERDAWEVRWYAVSSTRGLRTRLGQELAKKRKQRARERCLVKKGKDGR